MAKWWLLFWSVIVLVEIYGGRGCTVEEKMGLLEFKAFVESNGYDADYLLPSWVEVEEDDPQSDCCLWERVTCSKHTHHVIALSLDTLMEWRLDSSSTVLFNISILQPFKELRVLDLSYNYMNGWVENEDESSSPRGKLLGLKLETLDLSFNQFSNSTLLRSLSFYTSLKNLNLNNNIGMQGSFPLRDLKYLSKLSKLEYLDLSGNLFNKDIMRCLGSLPSLKSLDLSRNLMEGSLSDQDLKYLSKLSKLEYLDLSGNMLNEDIMRCLGSLPSLKALYLSNNFMESSWNEIEESLSNEDHVMIDLKTLSRLEILDLSGNGLFGNIPSKVRQLTSLKAISLARNNFSGSIPAGICELNRLEELDLRYNILDGVIPSCLNNMTSLRHIDLSGNHFDGSFNFGWLSNLSKLETIILTCGRKLKTDAEYLDQIPLFQLKEMSLSNCSLERIPKFLRHQHRLRAIDLSHNKLNGTFPAWLAENNTNLEFLNLRGNCFSGKLDFPTNSMRNIHWVDFSSNQFTGQLQEDFGKILSNAQFINLSHNHFEGDLPRSICATGELRGLDLSNNKFSGEVPKEVFTYCTYLGLLVLKHNKFQGEIFSTSFNLTQLAHLDLSDNQFTGSLSLSNIFYQIPVIDVLDISNNKFEGEIPSSVFNLYWIGIFALRNNSLQGQFPCKEQNLPVQYLDLSYNSLRGPLPYCFHQPYLKQLHVEGNQFSGSIPSPLLKFPALKVLNLKHNHLVGNIPYSIDGSLPSLRILLLGNNFLNGSIPKLLCRFRNISIMDLSNNNFSGVVPQCFYNISWGKVDVTSIFDKGPSKEVLTTFFPPSSYGVPARLLNINPNFLGNFGPPSIPVEVAFVTKNMVNFYKGDILNLMSGIDLSCNNLTGEIPPSLGSLSSIHTLNLSHNRLVRSIPTSFAKLAAIESLDLSYNNLSGRIPAQLGNLNFLSVFNVAQNNLSGEIPQTTQFSTFDESSFEGNPLLCGMPLKKSCKTPSPPHPPIVPSEETKGKWYEVDYIAFYASSAATYVVVLLAFVTVLYINAFWRRRWFLFIDNFLDSSYYFVYATLHKLWN